jgi:hemerythrin-like metal-binding protein
MAFMVWSDAFLTGIPMVDEQHRGLVDLLNRAAESLSGDEPPDAARAGPLLDGLFEYTRRHFADEREMMLGLGIDPRHADHHGESHASFVARLKELREEFEQGGGVTGDELLGFLANWLALHILDEDQRMARELAAIREGLSPAEAWARVEGSRAAILQNANDVLVSSMLQLFENMTAHNRQLSHRNEELKRVQQSLAAERDGLEARVRERTAELEQALAAAESASRAKTRFLGNLSHELMTPLNAILGFAHLLEDSQVAERDRDRVRRVLRAGEQLNITLSELLLYARLEGGEFALVERPFLPAGIPGLAAERISRALRARGLSVSLDIAPALPVLLGDETRLVEAMVAMANNAIRFTESGTLRLSVGCEAAGRPELRTLQLEVHDESFGLSAVRRAAVCGATGPLDDLLEHAQGGVGLGIGIAAEIARRMGGGVTVSTLPEGGGARFSLHVDLPVAPRAAGREGVTGRERADLARLLQLLAEDDLEARSLFRQMEPWLRQRFGDTAIDSVAKNLGNAEWQPARECLRALTDGD